MMWASLYLSLALVTHVGWAIIFEKCDLANLLESTYGMARDEVKNWVCIAEYESSFNTEAVNHYNSDGSYDYGLFQLNNKYWCKDNFNGKNACNMPCSALLDDDITNDLECVKKVVEDTERWKGKDTGLTAWVVYEKRCQNKNLDDYMMECWDNNNVINTREETTTQEPSTEIPTTMMPDNDEGTANEIINWVRVPIIVHPAHPIHSVPADTGPKRPAAPVPSVPVPVVPVVHWPYYASNVFVYSNKK